MAEIINDTRDDGLRSGFKTSPKAQYSLHCGIGAMDSILMPETGGVHIS